MVLHEIRQSLDHVGPVFLSYFRKQLNMSIASVYAFDIASDLANREHHLGLVIGWNPLPFETVRQQTSLSRQTRTPVIHFRNIVSLEPYRARRNTFKRQTRHDHPPFLADRWI